MRGPDYNTVFDLWGGRYVTDTAGYTGPWAGIKALTNTMISAVSGCPLFLGNLTNIQIGAGDFLPFPQSASFVQLVSGNAVLIKH
jgi:hypothetical protein